MTKTIAEWRNESGLTRRNLAELLTENRLTVERHHPAYTEDAVAAMDHQPVSRDLFRLEIRYNNTADHSPCVLCGRRTDSVIGPELFFGGTYAVVCFECGKLFNPELVDCLTAYRKQSPDYIAPDDLADPPKE